MRIFLTLLLFLNLLNADEKKQKITIGFGPYIQSQPYKDVSDIVIPSPVIFFDNGIFYVRWSRAGVYFLGEKTDEYSWGFSITGQPRTNNYNTSDSTVLTGLSEKKSSIEAGLAFSAQIGNSYIESMLLTDILDRYDSWIFKTEIGHDFVLGDFSFYPSLILIYQSSKYINYYYGISKEDASTSAYDIYTASNGLQLGFQTYIEYPLTDNLSALINLRYDRLSSEATASPIVEDDYIYSGLVSLIYTFHY